MVVKTRTTGIVGVTRLDAAPQSIEHRLFSANSSERQGRLFSTSFTERKSAFLHNLASLSGKTKYKRYTGAPIRYAGGKSLAVVRISE